MGSAAAEAETSNAVRAAAGSPQGGQGNGPGVGARSAPTEDLGKRSAQYARWHMGRTEFVRLTIADAAHHNRRFRTPAQAGALVAGARFA